MNRTICAVCRKPAPLKCGGCRSGFYCSRVCQTKDFPLHKLLCKDKFVADNPRPSSMHYLGLLFPKKSDLPQLKWIKTTEYREENCELYLSCTEGAFEYIDSGPYSQTPYPKPPQARNLRCRQPSSLQRRKSVSSSSDSGLCHWR
jgi:MYND finger